MSFSAPCCSLCGNTKLDTFYTGLGENQICGKCIVETENKKTNELFDNAPSSSIRGIDIGGGGWSPIPIPKEKFEEMLIKDNEINFQPEVAKRVGINLIVHKEEEGRAEDNQPVSILMINPRTGFAPPMWQSNVGKCTIVREDGLPYSSKDHEVIHDFMWHLLDRYGDGPVSAKHFTPLYFQEYARRRQGSKFDSKLMLPYICLHGLKTESMNGLEGFLDTLNIETNRHPVYLRNGKVVKVKHENIKSTPEPEDWWEDIENNL